MKLAQIYYMKENFFGIGNMGLDYLELNHGKTLADLSIGILSKTHKLLAVVPVDEVSKDTNTESGIDLPGLYLYFQGECWSRNGEARELVKALGLTHTSMSIGDIVVCEDKVFFCDKHGWEDISSC